MTFDLSHSFFEKINKIIFFFRSFKPFIPLLHCTQIPVIQLWAIWAIHHVFSTDRK